MVKLYHFLNSNGCYKIVFRKSVFTVRKFLNSLDHISKQKKSQFSWRITISLLKLHTIQRVKESFNLQIHWWYSNLKRSTALLKKKKQTKETKPNSLHVEKIIFVRELGGYRQKSCSTNWHKKIDENFYKASISAKITTQTLYVKPKWF